MKRTELCRPCACALERESGKRLQVVRQGVDQKVTCARCGRRRYGAVYEASDYTETKGETPCTRKQR